MKTLKTELLGEVESQLSASGAAFFNTLCFFLLFFFRTPFIFNTSCFVFRPFTFESDLAAASIYQRRAWTALFRVCFAVLLSFNQLSQHVFTPRTNIFHKKTIGNTAASCPHVKKIADVKIVSGKSNNRKAPFSQMKLLP